MKKVFEIINKNFETSHLLDMFHTKTDKIPPIITISREKGSGGRPIGFLVAHALGNNWKVYHKNIVDEIARSADFEKELVEEVDEKNIPVVEQIIDNVLGKNYMNLSSYYRHLIQILSIIGQRGSAIIIGRGANFLFPNALKIRIVCEMEERIRGVMKYEKVTRKEAISIVESSDEKRNAFTKSLYQHDQRKAHHYDLIIRTGTYMSPEDAAEIILLAAKRRFKL